MAQDKALLSLVPKLAYYRTSNHALAQKWQIATLS